MGKTRMELSLSELIVILSWAEQIEEEFGSDSMLALNSEERAVRDRLVTAKVRAQDGVSYE